MRFINVLVVFLFLPSVHLCAQVNVDSMMHVLFNSNTYQISDKMPHIGSSFVRFQSTDESNSYDVFLDATFNLQEDIGVAMIYREYDAEKRIVKRIGWSMSGHYSLWDYSPIIHITYSNDSLITDHFNRNYEFDARVITVNDSLGREIAAIEYDQKFNLLRHESKTYNDSLGELVVLKFDADGNIKSNRFGVAKHYLKYDPNDCTRFLEEQFYDLNMNLVEADHLFVLDGDADKYVYSTVRRVLKDSTWMTFFYNTNGKLMITGEETIGFYSTDY